MKLTLGEIKSSVRRLCFLEVSEYKEYEEAVLEAANYALLQLAKEFPLTESMKIEKTEKCAVSYDVTELAKEKGQDFMGFDEDFPVLKMGDEGIPLPGKYTLLKDRYLILEPDETGEFTVFYSVYPEKITSATSDEHEIEFAAEIASLMPLLMAWRIFKDDDETKAALYFNEYNQAKAETKPHEPYKRDSFRLGFWQQEGAYS